MIVRYHSIKHRSLVDGPGERSVVFLQGCSIQCSGCQNSHLWNSAGGYTVQSDTLALILSWTDRRRPSITISGGEPTDQPDALFCLLRDIRRLSASAHIVLYSGRTLEEIISRLGRALAWRILFLIDVLVDGPYVQALDHDRMQHRGSQNQRVINLPATIDAGELVLLDWDSPEVTISPAGSVLAAAGLINDFGLHSLGEARIGRICGATT